MADKAVYRVAAIGLEQRDLRLIEIVFRHSQYNTVEYRLAESHDPQSFDLLVANVFDRAGREAATRLRAAGRPDRLVVVVPRGMHPGNTGAIAADRLSLQLLPSLNKVVAMIGALQEPRPSRPGPTAQPDGAGVPPRPSVQPASSARVGSTPETLSQPVGARHAAGTMATPNAPSQGKPLVEGASKPPAKRAPEPHARDRRRSAARPLQVLIVDDSSTVRVQLQIALDRLGLGWASASSAAEAMEQLESRSFDLALVDVVMPDSDGYKLTREIKRDPRWRRMPVIILTSRSSPFDLARGALAGCDAYLSKPVPFRALQQALVNQLRKSLRIDDLSALMRLSDDSKQPEQAGSRLSRLFGR